MKHLITVVGPTAIGKTALSIILANHFKCEIISCDSRQFSEMTIGTAVPSTTELTAAPHHFIKINPYLRTIPLVILRKTRLKNR
jgi:tRNA dimethylallyltransferase